MENDMRTVFFTACIGQNVINGRKKKKKRWWDIWNCTISVCCKQRMKHGVICTCKKDPIHLCKALSRTKTWSLQWKLHLFQPKNSEQISQSDPSMSSSPDQCTQMEERQQHLHHQAKKQKTFQQHFQDRPSFLVSTCNIRSMQKRSFVLRMFQARPLI